MRIEIFFSKYFNEHIKNRYKLNTALKFYY